MSAATEAATDPGASAWVSANAGAGKTYLLTDRVTRLLLAGANPARILCLTYTKAAAAEMATRLFNRLGEWALLSDDELTAHLTKIGAAAPDAKALRKARRLFAQALETPGGLKIQTIHSFCQHVLARFPVEAGIPARFAVLDERSAAELMAEARGAVLERSAKGDTRLKNAIALLAARVPDGRFADIIDSAIGNGGKLRDVLAQHGGDEARLFAHLRNILGVEAGEDEAQALARFCNELGGERAICERIAQWLRDGSARDAERGERLAQFVALGMSADSFALLRRSFLKQDGEPFSPIATKDRVKFAPDLAAAAEDIQRRLLAADGRRKCAATATLTEAVVSVALAVIGAYDRLKRDRAALDYDDLTRKTQGLLKTREAASWVLYKLDGGLDHILVDEAQDTSPEQWKIVEMLTEEFFAGKGVRDEARTRTLFAVGDEKQSIFSFQGADPTEFGIHRGLFMERAQRATLPFTDLRLTVSRRGARSVLEFVDEVFAAEGAREGLTSSGDPIHHDPDRAALGRVEVWPAVEAPRTEQPDLWNRPVDALSRTGAQAVLAWRIASRIAAWIEDGATLPGSSAPIRAGDIMILVRRRNAFAEEMIRQLLDKGVPVAGADRMVLSEQIAIADLVALGRFALLPEDDLNLAALLKSPLVGVSEEELYDLAHGREGTLWSALRTRQHERPIFTAAHACLEGMLSKADFLPPFEFYAHALGKNLRKRLTARLGAEADDAIDEFLALALAHESSHAPSLESFLDWFEKGASDVKRDMEKGGGAVRVMTVHGAKGLEAEIVILPDTAQIPDHAGRGPLLYTDDCVFFGVPKSLETQAVTAAKDAARVREMNEYRRLLYVAATRAREFLIVCGYETKNGIREASWYPHLEAAARRIGHEEKIAGETVIAFGAELSAGAAAPARAEGSLTVLPEYFARTAEPEPPPHTLRPSEAAGLEEPALLSPLAEAGKRFRRGLLVHALLAHLPQIAPEKREAAALAYLTRQGLPASDATALIAETLGVIEHPAFAPLFAPDSRAEVAITAHLPELGNVRVNGQIDRLVVTKDAVLIADFKTNRPPPARVEDTPRLYRTQLALYRAALQKIYPGKRIDCALVWTDGARLMPLPPDMLEAELTRIASGATTQDVA